MILIGGTFTAPNAHRVESAPLHPDWFELNDLIPITRIVTPIVTHPDLSGFPIY